MKPTAFQLVPFESTPQTDALSLCGEVDRAGNQLSIRYQLSGDLSNVELSSLDSSGQRRDRLWEKTCFEFFLRPADSSQSHYWEINLSPNGDWNIFSLSSYRADLKEEPAIAHLPFHTQLKSNQLQLALSTDIAPLISHQDAQIGISTVLVIAGKETYWAISHPAPQADFHHPDSFAINFPYRPPSSNDRV